MYSRALTGAVTPTRTNSVSTAAKMIFIAISLLRRAVGKHLLGVQNYNAGQIFAVLDVTRKRSTGTSPPRSPPPPPPGTCRGDRLGRTVSRAPGSGIPDRAGHPHQWRGVFRHMMVERAGALALFAAARPANRGLPKQCPITSQLLGSSWSAYFSDVK